jgi:tetratricopeptide (TPR) repeat protein
MSPRPAAARPSAPPPPAPAARPGSGADAPPAIAPARRSAAPARAWPRLLPALLVLLAACAERDPDADAPPPQVYRRSNVPFAEAQPTPTDAELAQSRTMDELEALVRDGRDGEARTRLADYFAKGGSHPRAHYLAGRLAVGVGDDQAAITHFSQAVAGSPHWITPRLDLAQCYLRLERTAAAENVYQDIDHLLPEGPWGPWGMGVLAWQRGDAARGKALLDEALKRDPKHAPSLRARAGIARIGNEAELEADLLERYLVQEPDDAEAHVRLGDLAQSAQRFVDAERHFRDGYDLSPQPAVARRLADLATRRGDEAEAREWQRLAGTAEKPKPGAGGGGAGAPK